MIIEQMKREDVHKKYICKKIVPPKKGDIFERASGIKGIVNIEIAEQDHERFNYPILELINE